MDSLQKHMRDGEKREGMGHPIAQYHLCKTKLLHSTVYFSSVSNYLNKHIADRSEVALNILTGAYRG